MKELTMDLAQLMCSLLLFLFSEEKEEWLMGKWKEEETEKTLLFRFSHKKTVVEVELNKHPDSIVESTYVVQFTVLGGFYFKNNMQVLLKEEDKGLLIKKIKRSCRMTKSPVV